LASAFHWSNSALVMSWTLSPASPNTSATYSSSFLQAASANASSEWPTFKTIYCWSGVSLS
jgi:hypothetical protein